MKSCVTRFCLFLCALNLCAEISFMAPDINARNEVLFSVKADIPGRESYQTLFRENLDTGVREQLTFYPEAMEAISGGSVLQIRNRFGSGRWTSAGETFSWLDETRPFRSGGDIRFGMLSESSSSPDGRWLVTVEPVSPARGRLVLFDTVKELRFVLAESVDRGRLPVSWAPDSSVLIYSVDHTLYFARPASFFSATALDARYRVLGPGGINCISWFSATRLLYISGASVYRIQASELFARSLYTPLIGIGDLAGKLPCPFMSATDQFCASPDGTAVLYARDGRNVYYCPLEGDDYVSVMRPALLPYLLLPGNTSGLSFVWTADGLPAVFARSVEAGRNTLKAWKLTDQPTGKVFSTLSVPTDASDICPSPNGSFVAFVTPQALSVLSTATWKEIASWRDETVVSVAWGEDPCLFIGGTETVRKWNFRTGVSALVTLSQAAGASWDEQGTSVVADTPRLGRFQYAGALKWTQAAGAKTRPASSANSAWRLYLDSGRGYYANMLYIRSATAPGGTRALVAEPDRSASAGTGAATDASRPVSPGVSPSAVPPSLDASGVFSHGERTGLREVSVVFDAMDSLDGLPFILHVLEQYKIRATFFINGEFIRQHPAAVNEIVKAGHQTASLFFTTWDLSGTRYRIDEDFIVRGLSRNEDDFYGATGQELTLLWHAPYYVTSPMILAAGARAGYRYVSGDVTVLDWVTAAQERMMPGLYRDAAGLVEDIAAAVKPGSIIPVRIGKVEGERSDYLFEKIDLLINALIEDGYRIVPVETLIRNAERVR